MRSRSSIVFLLDLRGGSYRGRLFRDVDADGAPSDAPAAAHASRRAELIVPMRKLVGHPLPVARARCIPHASAMDIGEIEGEAGIPQAHALSLRAGEIAAVLYRRAEAGGANHCAIAASEAALAGLVPSRMP